MKKMKSTFLLSAFFLFTNCFLLTSCYSARVQQQDKLSCIQIIDRNGLSETISSKEKLKNFQQTNFLHSQPYQQVLQVFEKNSLGKIPASLTSYYPNGALHQYLEILDARAFGKYKEWHSNGQTKIDSLIVGGPSDFSFASQQKWLFDGLCKAFDEEGHLLSSISYQKGSLEGESLYYFPQGKIQKKIFYLHNEIDGLFEEFYENGKLAIQIPYKKGKKEGKAMSFFETSSLQSEEFYQNDALLSGKYFDQNQHLLSQISEGKGKKALFQNNQLSMFVEYNQGKEEGKVEIFSHHLIQKTFFIKNGQKQGEEVEYFLPEDFSLETLKLSKEKLQPKISLCWEEDMIHGKVKTWYKSGQLESEKEFSQNKKNGPSCAWYKDGNIMFIEEYEDDLLLKGAYYKRKEKIPISTIIKGNGIATLYDGEGLFLKKIFYKKGKPLEE